MGKHPWLKSCFVMFQKSSQKGFLQIKYLSRITLVVHYLFVFLSHLFSVKLTDKINQNQFHFRKIKISLLSWNFIFRFYSPVARFLTAQDIEMFVRRNIAYVKGQICFPFINTDSTSVSFHDYRCYFGFHLLLPMQPIFVNFYTLTSTNYVYSAESVSTFIFHFLIIMLDATCVSFCTLSISCFL